MSSYLLLNSVQTVRSPGFILVSAFSTFALSFPQIIFFGCGVLLLFRLHIDGCSYSRVCGASASRVSLRTRGDLVPFLPKVLSRGARRVDARKSHFSRFGSKERGSYRLSSPSHRHGFVRLYMHSCVFFEQSLAEDEDIFPFLCGYAIGTDVLMPGSTERLSLMVDDDKCGNNALFSMASMLGKPTWLHRNIQRQLQQQ